MFQAKQSLVRDSQLKVQELSLPFKIVGSATPASVSITVEDPAILFVRTEGINQITAALDSDDTAPTYGTQSDAGGDFSVLIVVGEEIRRVVSCKVVNLSTEKDVSNAILPSAPSDGIVAGGALDKIALDVKNFQALTSGTVYGSIEVKYIVQEA